MNNDKMLVTQADGTTANGIILDDVIAEILMSDEQLTGAKLNEWISRFPQFGQGLTDFAVEEAVSEFAETEAMTESEAATRLMRSQRIATNIVRKLFCNSSKNTV